MAKTELPRELDAVAELKELQARKATRDAEHERDADETQRRIDEIYKIQAPLCDLLDQRRKLYGTVAKIENLKTHAVANDKKNREEFHAHATTWNALGDFGRHLEIHWRLFNAGQIIAEYNRSLSIVKAEIENVEHAAADYAKANRLESLLGDLSMPPADI